MISKTLKNFKLYKDNSNVKQKNAQFSLRILYINNSLIKNIISLSTISLNTQPFLFQIEPNVRKARQLYQED